MEIVFLGCTKYSEQMLHCLLIHKFDIRAIFTIPQEFHLKKKGKTESQVYNNSNYSDLSQIADDYGIACHVVDTEHGRGLSSYSDLFKKIQPDVILVLGWYYFVPKAIREIAKIGTFGIHASLLPEYAGGSPLVWAIINGENRTGITMFRFEDGVDDGDILAQREIEIDKGDTIATLYDKVAYLSKEILVSELVKISKNECVFYRQDKSKIKPYPIRTPEDGIINWAMTDIDLYNFVRAQTKPYPCAFSYLFGKKIKILSIYFPNISYQQHYQYSNGKIVFMDSIAFVKVANNFVRISKIEVDDQEFDFTDYCIKNNLSGYVFQRKRSDNCS